MGPVASRPLAADDGRDSLLAGTAPFADAAPDERKTVAATTSQHDSLLLLSKAATMQPIIEEEAEEASVSLTAVAGAAASQLTSTGGSFVTTGNRGALAREVVLFYFAGQGRADPIRQMFEYRGQPYKKIDIDPAYWEEKKAAGEGGEFGGGLPQVLYQDEDGEELELGQFGAILRHFGIRYGYYATGSFEMARYADPIVEAFGDLMGHLAQIIFAPADSDKTPLISAYLEFVQKYHTLVENNLAHHGGRYAAGDQVTIADFVMASYIGNYLVNPAFVAHQEAQELVSATPRFEAYVATIQQEFTYLKTRPAPGPF